MRNTWVLPSALCLLLPLLTACGSDDGGGDDGPSSYAGKTYLLRIGAGDFGPGIGAEIDPDGVPEFALKVDGSGSTYDVTVGTGYTPDGGVWAQEMCNPTTHVPATSNPYPGFSLGPIDLPLYLKHPVQDASARGTAYQFTLTNVLLAEGTEGTGTLSAILDAREVYPVFPQLGVGADGDTMCEYLANNEIDTCKACPSDGALYCLTLTATYLGAPVSDITLQETPGFADTCFFN